MVLNRIWIGMFLIAIVMGFSKLIFWQDTAILQKMMDGLFEASKNGFELSIFMTGALCLWMGFMKIGEEGGAIKIMSKLDTQIKKVLKAFDVALIGGNIDEAPMAYKDIEKVMGNQTELVEVLGTFTPKIVRMDR